MTENKLSKWFKGLRIYKWWLRMDKEDKKAIRAFIIVFALCVVAAVIALILESHKLLDGKFLSEFFGGHLQNHDLHEGSDGETILGKSDTFYTMYYVVLLVGVIAYILSALWICCSKHTPLWCALCIFISLVFIIAADEWLTITLEYDNSARLYNLHLMCYISVATILSGISAAKMAALFKLKYTAECNGHTESCEMVQDSANGNLTVSETTEIKSAEIDPD